jgi:hypothetical protein
MAEGMAVNMSNACLMLPKAKNNKIKSAKAFEGPQWSIF